MKVLILGRLMSEVVESIYDFEKCELFLLC